MLRYLRSERVRRITGNPFFAGMTAALGAFVGLLGAVYTDEIKAAFPFTAIGAVIVWHAFYFWTLLIVFGFCFFLNIQGQNDTLDSALSKLSGSTQRLEALIRTLPPEGFLAQFERYYREAFAAAAYAMRPEGSEREIKEAAILCLACLGYLTRYFDGNPKGVRYAVNIMRFRPMPVDAKAGRELLEKSSFVGSGSDPATFDGVLELLPDFALSISDAANRAPDGVIPISLPIPKKPFRMAQGRTTVLPGAPMAFCNPSRVTILMDTATLGARCKKETALDHSVADDIDSYFNSQNGQLIRSFVSLNFGITIDGTLSNYEQMGIVNIHSSDVSILGEEGARLFVPLTQPFLEMLGGLFRRFERDSVHARQVLK